jgi:hypothetical protein
MRYLLLMWLIICDIIEFTGRLCGLILALPFLCFCNAPTFYYIASILRNPDKWVVLGYDYESCSYDTRHAFKLTHSESGCLVVSRDEVISYDFRTNFLDNTLLWFFFGIKFNKIWIKYKLERFEEKREYKRKENQTYVDRISGKNK